MSEMPPLSLDQFTHKNCPLRLAVIWMLLLGAWSHVAGQSTTVFPRPLETVHLHNTFQATPNIYSGTAPDSDSAFQELVNLGVKTVVSVDGSRPDLKSAQKHGLKYIHLPIGYDGVPSNRVVELIQAGRSAAGPLYVHCHHGKHRGPAAAAIVCLGVAGWTPAQAVAFLHQAGTSPEYVGLYQSVGQYQPPTVAQLSKSSPLPESTATSSLVEFMVAIDGWFDQLKAAQKAQWQSDPKHPGELPAQNALLVWEQLRELQRLDDTKQRPASYRESLAKTESMAQAFYEALRRGGSTTTDLNDSFQRLSQSCNECHKAHRN